jgi:hypothetical protein
MERSALRDMLEVVNLSEFYEHIETLILDLRSSGHPKESEEVEIAIRGGATGGEILGRLSVELPSVARRLPEYRAEVDVLAAWAKEASGLR